ncbi:MAG: DUF2269 family protein [Chloroflexi bacterium]|nr:DUF2269 family protein [Chloroflexota bacterium]
MNAEDVLAFVHVLSAFWFVAGLAGVLLPIIRAWASRDVPYQVTAIEEASHYQGLLLVPGAIAAGATGFFLWAELEYNLLTTGWLVALELVYLFVLLVCLPLLAVSLRRARLASLQAAKAGKVTAELEEVLSDNAPVVVGGLTVLTIPAMTYLSVFKPW